MLHFGKFDDVFFGYFPFRWRLSRRLNINVFCDLLLLGLSQAKFNLSSIFFSLQPPHSLHYSWFGTLSTEKSKRKREWEKRKKLLHHWLTHLFLGLVPTSQPHIALVLQQVKLVENSRQRSEMPRDFVVVAGRRHRGKFYFLSFSPYLCSMFFFRFFFLRGIIMNEWIRWVLRRVGVSHENRSA